MTDGVQAYCAATRQLAHIQRTTKEDLQEIRDTKKAANALLLELQTEEEMVAKLEEGCFCVRVKVTHKRPTQGIEILQKMEEFWESGGLQEWKARVARDPDEDPVDSLIETVIGAAWPAPLEKRSLEIKKAKETSARVQDLPEAPAKNMPLLSSIVEAKRIMSEKLSSVKEDKKKLVEQCKEAEMKIIPELLKLPDGYIRKVNLRDSSGGDESFYLRLKPPRKRTIQKFTSKKVEVALKNFLQERAPCNSRQAVIDRIASPRFGVSMCRDVAESLLGLAKETASGPRVVLDRLKDSRSDE
jgi:hypothetical protein